MKSTEGFIVNPSLHLVSSIFATPTKSPIPLPHQFNLSLRYKEDGETYFYECTHVPPGLQHYLLSGKIKSLHIETLEANSIAAKSLGVQPKYLVCGVVTTEGESIVQIPSQIEKVRSLHLWGGALMCIAGILLFIFKQQLAGAALFTVGTHGINASFRMPVSPLKTLYTYR